MPLTPALISLINSICSDWLARFIHGDSLEMIVLLAFSEGIWVLFCTQSNNRRNKYFMLLNIGNKNTIKWRARKIGWVKLKEIASTLTLQNDERDCSFVDARFSNELFVVKKDNK